MRSRPTIAALAIAASAIGAPAALADASGHRAGAVFTLTNQAAGNAVAAYARAADGTLTPVGSAATGGAGTGAGLGSQGALTLDRAGERLFAVDAGSDEITAFVVGGYVVTDRMLQMFRKKPTAPKATTEGADGAPGA